MLGLDTASFPAIVGMDSHRITVQIFDIVDC
jgi:hypothetical protein